MDENNLDPEQIRQLNEAFQELQETVRSTTETVKTKDLQKSIDSTKKSVDKLQTEFDKLAQLIKNTSNTARNTSNPSKKESDVNTPNLDTSIFDNALKSMAGGFSGLNNVTLNLIKSFSSLSDLLKDKTSTTKISERHRERTKQIIEGVEPVKLEPAAPVVSDPPEEQPASRVTSEPVTAPAQPDLSPPTSPQPSPNLESITAQNVTIEGLQKLAQSLNEADKSILRNTGYIKDGNGNWKKYSSLMDIAIQKQEALIDPVDKQLAAIEDTVRSYGYVQDENGKWVSSIAELTDAQKKELAQKKEALEQLIKEGKARKEQEDREKQRKKAEEDLIKNFKELSKTAGTDLAKNFFNSSQGMGKYGETLGKFGGGIIDVTKNLGPLGRAAGLAAGGLFKLVGATLKQNEALNKAYEELSTFGAVDFRGITQMFSNLQNAGFTVQQLEKFTGILKTAGPNLAGLGVTAADGAKKVSDSFAAIKNTKVEEQLRMLGYNSETLFQTFTDYQGMIARLGRTQNLSTKQLADRSAAYAKNLDELSKLTGESRDNLQKQQEAIQSDITFRTVLAQLADDEQERVKKLVTLMEQYGEETGKGVRNLLANAGPTIDEASNLYLQTGSQVQILINKFKQGTISAEEFSYEFAKAVKNNSKQLGVDIDNRKKLSQIQNNAFGADQEVTRQMMGNAKLMDQVNKQLSKTPEQMAEANAQTAQQMKKDNDSQRAAENARAMTERNFEQAKDRLVQLVGKGVTGAFEKLMTVVNNVGKGLAKFVKFITFGIVDMTDIFQSTDDIANNLKQTQSELDKTNKQLGDIATARERYQQKEKEYLAKNEEINNLEIAISKENNAEKKKAMNAELEQKQKERAALKAEADKAKTDFSRGDRQTKKLTADKERLEKQKLDQEKELEKAGVNVESPEIAKLRKEEEKLLEEKIKVDALVLDKQRNLYNAVAKELGFDEEKLKNKENLEKVNKEYEERKKELQKKQIELNKKINDIAEERAAAEARVISGATGAPKTASTVGATATPGTKSTSGPSSTSPSATRSKDAGSGRGSVGMPQVQPEEGVEVAYGGKASPQKILDFIAKHESRGDYNILVGGQKAPLTTTTVGQVQQYQSTMKARGFESSAVGRYQIIKDTLAGAAKEAGVSSDQLFDEKTQDSLGTALLKRRGYDKYASGEMSAAQFADSLAMEWASLPKEDGRSHYAGVGSNKALTSRKEFMDVLEQARTGGMFSGPESGYPVLLHGNELVISQPDIPGMVDALSKVKKTEIQNLLKSNTAPSDSAVTAADDSLRPLLEMQNGMIEMLSDRLNTMIDKLSTSNDIQDRILTYQQT